MESKSQFEYTSNIEALLHVEEEVTLAPVASLETEAQKRLFEVRHEVTSQKAEMTSSQARLRG